MTTASAVGISTSGPWSEDLCAYAGVRASACYEYRSVSVLVTLEVLLSPTLWQFVVLGQESPNSSLIVAPGAFGLDTIDHAVPLKRSTSVLVPVPLLELPTA